MKITSVNVRKIEKEGSRLLEYAEKEGYKGKDALFEVYVTDPSEVKSEADLITEIYYPVRKIRK